MTNGPIENAATQLPDFKRVELDRKPLLRLNTWCETGIAEQWRLVAIQRAGELESGAIDKGPASIVLRNYSP